MKVHLTPGVYRQLESIFVYIAASDPVAADKVVARIEAVFQFLAGNPYAGRAISGSRMRRFPVQPYPYLIYYRVVGDEVKIIRVRHAARRRAAFHEPAAAFRY